MDFPAAAVQTAEASPSIYATTYEYGQAGFTDTVAFLKLNTGPDDVIASTKDIGFCAGRPYYENYQALYSDEQTEQWLIHAIASGKVVYEVFTEGRGEDQLAVKPSLQKMDGRALLPHSVIRLLSDLQASANTVVLELISHFFHWSWQTACNSCIRDRSEESRYGAYAQTSAVFPLDNSSASRLQREPFISDVLFWK